MKPLATTRRRVRLGMIVLLGLLFFLASRLVVLQGFDSDGNAEAAAAQRTQVQTLAATRGRILDVEGRILAETVLRYDIVVDQVNNATEKFTRVNPETQQSELISRNRGIAELAAALGAPIEEVRKALTGTKRYNVVAGKISPEMEEKVAALRIPGITSVPVSQRVYPMGQVAGNIVGFVNDDGVGSGIEYTQNKKLEGHDGHRTYQRGKDGIVIPYAPAEVVPPQNGQDIRLTINADLQFTAQQAISEQVDQLHADWGNIVVVQVKTGNIVAMAETNTLDPNNPGKSRPEDRDSRSVTAAIEPGSTEKAITAAGVIEEGKGTPFTPLVIPPTYTIGGQVFSDAENHGTINRTFAGVLGESLNTGTVMMGSRLNRQQRYDYLRKFGVGEKTGIPLPGESPGILAKPAQWDGRQEYTVLFGQGVAQTPLQTTMVYQALANGGVRLQPRLVDALVGPGGRVQQEPQSKATPVVTPETAHQVRDMLEGVVTMAPWNKVGIPGYRVGGKTGTAESPVSGGFRGYTASFVGIAPMDDPQYVALINVQHPQGDIYGITQGPVFNNVMSQVLQTERVPPSTTPPVKPKQTF